jgi:co-chaperonin GroES (HSP10)
MGWSSFKPIGPRVLVRLDPEDTSIGFLHLPELCRFTPTTGTVVSVSDGYNRRTKDKRGRHEYSRLRSRVDIEPGARVCFGKFNGVIIESPSHDPTGVYVVMDVEPMQNDYIPDVYGVLEDDVQESERAA